MGSGSVSTQSVQNINNPIQFIDDENGCISDAKFKAFGCGAAIASSALITDWVKGKQLDEAKAIKNEEVAEYLSLPPVKLHCSVLAEEAVSKAIENYKSKQKK